MSNRKAILSIHQNTLDQNENTDDVIHGEAPDESVCVCVCAQINKKHLTH